MYVLAGLMGSLENPNFVGPTRGGWLVEVRVFDLRIGYFVAARVEDFVVI